MVRDPRPWRRLYKKAAWKRLADAQKADAVASREVALAKWGLT
jgi:hypothetical protein